MKHDSYPGYPADRPPPSTPAALHLFTTEDGVRVWMDPDSRHYLEFWLHLPGEWDAWVERCDLLSRAAQCLAVAGDSPDYSRGKYLALTATYAYAQLIAPK